MIFQKSGPDLVRSSWNAVLKVRSLRIRTKSLDLAPANNESYIPWKEIVAVTFDTKNIMPIDPVFRVLSEKQG